MSALAIAFLGFGFPVYLAYLGAVYQFNIWYVGIFTFLSLLGGVTIPLALHAITESLAHPDEDYEEQLDDMVRAFRALLKRMDDVLIELREIDRMLSVEE